MHETPPGEQTRVDNQIDSTIAGTQEDRSLGVAASAEIGPGTRIDRFEILAKLGAGGMGVVYEAHDTHLGRKVALKLLASDRAGSSARDRLLREAQAMARLAHPNVAAVHEVGRFGERVFLAMELVEGPSLDVWLAQEHDWSERVRMLVEAGEGLVAAHAAGLVHRDFKPANVMVGPSGRPRVLDFGLVRTRAAESVSDDAPEDARAPESEASQPYADRLSSKLTQAGAIMGTPAYMAPEQLEGLEVDERSDQFSFCVTVYEAVYGERPFTGATMAALLLARSQPPAFPERSSVPRDIARILARGLSREPGDRWPSMVELLAELRAQISAHADPERDLAVGRRQRALLLLGLCTTMIVVVISMEAVEPERLLRDPVSALQLMTVLTAIGLAITIPGARFVGRNRINRQLIHMVISFQVSIWLNRVIAVPLMLGWPGVYLLDLASLAIVGLFSALVVHRTLIVITGLATCGLGLACWQVGWAPQVSLAVNLAALISVVLIWRGGKRDQAQAEAAMSSSQTRSRPR